jgi:hypothetical protein
MAGLRVTVSYMEDGLSHRFSGKEFNTSDNY